MKWFLSILFASIFLYANEVSDTITNNTNEDMLCVESYPSVYEKKDVNGKQKRVKVLDDEKYIKTLKPNKSIKKKREGNLNCYNEFKDITSPKDNRIFQTNERTIESHLISHNKYNLTLYENKTRDFVEKNFGIAQRCAPYQKGEYCNFGYGLDIFFNENKKVKTIYLYENTVNRGKLAFKEESILKLYTNSKPLGLWVVKDYKKLFSKKPAISTTNLIMWENLTKHIKRVTVIPKNGYFKLSYKMKDGHSLFKNGYEDSEEPMDYIGSIQIFYK